MAIGMFMLVRMSVLVAVFVPLVKALLAPELFPRQLFLTGGDHVNLGRADAAAIDARDFQARIHAQRLHGAGEDLWRNSGIDQRAKKHIAADPGEAF